MSVSALSTSSLLVQWQQSGYATDYNVTVNDTAGYSVQYNLSSAIIGNLSWAGQLYSVDVTPINQATIGATANNVGRTSKSVCKMPFVSPIGHIDVLVLKLHTDFRQA
jgi:hypothetical protein